LGLESERVGERLQEAEEAIRTKGNIGSALFGNLNPSRPSGAQGDRHVAQTLGRLPSPDLSNGLVTRHRRHRAVDDHQVGFRVSETQADGIGAVVATPAYPTRVNSPTDDFALPESPVRNAPKA
jgi:hypothetical protein